MKRNLQDQHTASSLSLSLRCCLYFSSTYGSNLRQHINVFTLHHTKNTTSYTM